MEQSVYRVHWLASKETSQRWQEEFDITTREMEWTSRFFIGKAGQWAANRDRLLTDGHKPTSGVICYAERQRSMWNDFAAHAQQRYQEVNKSYEYIQSSL
jgi:hypothetical protein